MVRAFGIAIGSDAFVSAFGRGEEIASTAAVLRIGPHSPPVLGTSADVAAGSGETFRGFTTRVGDRVPMPGGRNGAELVAIAVECLIGERLSHHQAEVVLAHPVVWSNNAIRDLASELARRDIRHWLVTDTAAIYRALADSGDVPARSSVLICNVGRSAIDMSVVGPGDDGLRIIHVVRFDDAGAGPVESLALRQALRPCDRASSGPIRAGARTVREQHARDTAGIVDVALPGVRESHRILRADRGELLADPVRRIAALLRDCADLPVDSIVLTGDAPALSKLAERLSAAVARPVVVDPTPADTVVRGAAIIATRIVAALTPTAADTAISRYDRPLFDPGPPTTAFAALPARAPSRPPVAGPATPIRHRKWPFGS